MIPRLFNNKLRKRTKFKKTEKREPGNDTYHR